MKITKTGCKNWILVLVSLVWLGFLPLMVYADNVVQVFSISQTFQPGLVVALDKNDYKTVLAMPPGDTGRIYGVVVDPSDAPLTLNSTNSQTFVATSGIYRVLVSTSNGAIKAGDYISMSNLNGIAAKATNVQSTVLGQAETGFDGHSGIITN